ncbi:MAG: cysteine methyltransferase [uncultured bacterium]|nr:MAG: cysteine methyltransferase [uncultured bacterium]
MRNYSKTGGKKGMPGYRTPSSFQAKVFLAVKKIPKGETLTYMQVAKLIGNPKSYRAVGNALNKNCDPDVPCHRVIRSNGSVGGFNRGTNEKIKILKKEGAIK